MHNFVLYARAGLKPGHTPRQRTWGLKQKLCARSHRVCVCVECVFSVFIDISCMSHFPICISSSGRKQFSAAIQIYFSIFPAILPPFALLPFLIPIFILFIPAASRCLRHPMLPWSHFSPGYFVLLNSQRFNQCHCNIPVPQYPLCAVYIMLVALCVFVHFASLFATDEITIYNTLILLLLQHTLFAWLPGSEEGFFRPPLMLCHFARALLCMRYRSRLLVHAISFVSFFRTISFDSDCLHLYRSPGCLCPRRFRSYASAVAARAEFLMCYI